MKNVCSVLQFVFLLVGALESKKKNSSLLPPTVTFIEESFVFLRNKTINQNNQSTKKPAVDTESAMLAKQFLQM